jgi:hypothetical protein
MIAHKCLEQVDRYIELFAKRRIRVLVAWLDLKTSMVHSILEIPLIPSSKNHYMR